MGCSYLVWVFGLSSVYQVFINCWMTIVKTTIEIIFSQCIWIPIIPFRMCPQSLCDFFSILTLRVMIYVQPEWSDITCIFDPKFARGKHYFSKYSNDFNFQSRINERHKPVFHYLILNHNMVSKLSVFNCPCDGLVEFSIAVYGQ